MYNLEFSDAKARGTGLQTCAKEMAWPDKEDFYVQQTQRTMQLSVCDRDSKGSWWLCRAFCWHGLGQLVSSEGRATTIQKLFWLIDFILYKYVNICTMMRAVTSRLNTFPFTANFTEYFNKQENDLLFAVACTMSRLWPKNTQHSQLAMVL